MDNTRQQKIAKLIQKELADIFLQDGLALYKSMITVTKTTVSSDLSIARGYLSLFQAADPDAVMKEIRTNTKDIRFRLGQKVKHQLRIVPQLEFFIDDSLDYLEKIEKLLQQ
ncbi:MAG: 30S ribosome-binding factor RbfA [Bacteroidales bacterium]|jgi:ribosome-binding factor A|nr:30S ribosome-binding factor RbfA [Bacteroidales bacterium]